MAEPDGVSRHTSQSCTRDAAAEANKIKGELLVGEDPRAKKAAATAADAWAKARTGDRRPSYLRDVVGALDVIKDGKGVVAANRTQAYARAAYSWATRRDLVPANPVRETERPGREGSRERVLSLAELGAIWRACEKLGGVRGAFVQTLMLTLQRREEVGSSGEVSGGCDA